MARYGLVDGGGPLLTMVTRLVEQKGVDLLLPLVPYLQHLGATLIVLGDGEQALADALDAAAAAHTQQVAFIRGTTRPWLTNCSAAPTSLRCRAD